MSYRSRLYNHRNAQSPEGNTVKPFFQGKPGSAEKNSTPAFFQAKLSVNEPGDQYEREADNVADAVVNNKAGKHVVQQKAISNVQRLATSEEDEKLSTNDERMKHDKEIQRAAIPDEEKEKKIQKMDAPEKEKEEKGTGAAIQKKASEGGGAASPAVSSKIESTAGKGKSLPENTLHEMNTSFGADFSNVNIHTDTEAVNLNKELGAHAFTHGSDVYFSSGKFDTGSNSGKHLLAHELTHVIQQDSTRTKGSIGGKTISSAHSGMVQGSWIGDRIAWVKDAVESDNWGTPDPPGAYYVLNGLSMDDMIKVLRGLSQSNRKKISDNLNDNGGGFDRSRIQLALTNSETPASDNAFREKSENLHWAIRSGNFFEPPDGAFFQLIDSNAAMKNRLLSALNRDALDALIEYQKEGYNLNGGREVMKAIYAARYGAGSTKFEKHLDDLMNNDEWNTFFLEFNFLNETDQLRFLRGNQVRGGLIFSHIKLAKGIIDLNQLQYILEKSFANSATSLYVDFNVKSYRWQPKYKVNNPADFSNIIGFGNVFDSELDINSISDETMSDEEAEQQFKNAKPGPGGFLWPAVLNRSTLPVLWQVKQNVRRQMNILLFDPVLLDAIFVVQYYLNVLIPLISATAIRSLSLLRRASLSTRWLRGSQVLRQSSAVENKARQLAAQLAEEGKPVVANIGGAGAPHEPADAININNQVVGRKDIPNHVNADGSDIGRLFDPNTLDRIEGYNMSPDVVDWSRAAPGSFSTLKSGGKLTYRFRGDGKSQAIFAVEQLEKAGFKDVSIIGKEVNAHAGFTAVKP